MMSQVPFVQRVINVAISEATWYQSVYVDWEYLICSSGFQHIPYYIVAAKQDNYAHLLGVNLLISAQEFFEKCLAHTLSQEDFDFAKRNQTEKEVIGSVRRKIRALPAMATMLNDQLIVEEQFVKNKISCAFASSDSQITVGYTKSNFARPQTLLWKNELTQGKAAQVTLILRRKSGAKLFDEVLVGSEEALCTYRPIIGDLLADDMSYSMG